MLEGKIKQELSYEVLFSSYYPCAGAWVWLETVMAVTSRVCVVFFSPWKAAVHPCFPTLFFRQALLSLLPPLSHPLCFLSGWPAAMSRRHKLFWHVLALGGTGGLVMRTDLWMFHVRCVPDLGFFLIHPDRWGAWVGLLPLPELNISLLD